MATDTPPPGRTDNKTDVSSRIEVTESEIEGRALDVRRLVLRPGDVLVAEVPERLTSANSALLRSHLAEHVPPGVRILIMDNGITLYALDASAVAPDVIPNVTDASCVVCGATVPLDGAGRIERHPRLGVSMVCDGAGRYPHPRVRFP